MPMRCSALLVVISVLSGCHGPTETELVTLLGVLLALMILGGIDGDPPSPGGSVLRT